MKKILTSIMVLTLMLMGCSKNNSSSSLSSSSITNYDELQPLAYCSFDNLDDNGNYYDEISGESFYLHGSLEKKEGKYGSSAVFNGKSSLELSTFKDKSFKGNKSHTIMAYVKIDYEKMKAVPGHVIGGLGEYSHLSDSRLMVYNNNLCVTSYDILALSPIPQTANSSYQHLAMTYDGSTYKLFVNKKQVVVLKASEGINIKKSSLFVGGFCDNTMGFIGEIDEFYFF